MSAVRGTGDQADTLRQMARNVKQTGQTAKQGSQATTE